MKKYAWIQYVIVALTVLLAVALMAGIYISNEISSASNEDYMFEDRDSALYHVMVIIDGSYQTYDDQFITGLNQGAQKYKVAVEVIELSSGDYIDEALQTLDMAMYAQVDGIILHAIKNEALSEKVTQVMEAGIGVVVMNEDLPDSHRVSYVGVNRYNIGQVAGKALAAAMNGRGQVAIIEQRVNQASEEQVDDLLILGLTDVFKEYTDLNLSLIKYTQQGLLSAESVANEIIRNHPEIDGIFCTSGENTLGVAQALIDNNYVSAISLVGFGDEDELLAYIEKGKIAQSTIVTDNKDIGETALKTFVEYVNDQFVSSYVNTKLLVVSEHNVTDYMEERMKDDEESQ